MSLLVQSEAPPLREDASGALRVGHSRVLLELVVEAFEDGATPEAIAQRYPTVTLPDVYAVIAYYLRHPTEVQKYMAEREEKGIAVRAKIENCQGDMSAIRERIAKARVRGNGHAANGG